MRIGGLQYCSLIDYPGKISAIVFTLGCNFRCPYCHNPELVDETATEIPEAKVFDFLTRRKNLLDAVTVTGGEPTLHEDLMSFLGKIKAMGFLVKLDSNGTNPDVLERIIDANLADYIAMDVKAPLRSYEKTVGRPVSRERLEKSISLLLQGKVRYEFRTTVIKSLLSFDDLREIGESIRGAKVYNLQKFNPRKTLNPAFLRKTTYSDSEFGEMQKMMSEFVEECEVR
jgi:pyruvate formate lyase activating enzyme